MENKTLILNQDATTATVVWLHGLGAAPNDFIFFSELFPNITWVLPSAPHRLITIYQETMPAWFDIASPDRLTPPEQTGIIDTHKNISLLCQQYAKDSKPIFLGGFSQGAAQALYTGMHLPANTLSGIIAMSGYCPFNVKNLIPPPILVLHGTYDDVISWSLANTSYQTILNNEATDLKLFPCAHSWHPGMENEIELFLKKYGKN